MFPQVRPGVGLPCARAALQEGPGGGSLMAYTDNTSCVTVWRARLNQVPQPYACRQRSSETLELQRLGELVIAPGGKHVRQRPASGGNGLESPGSPAAVDVQPRDRSRSDDGAGVVHYIDDPGPLPQQTQPAEGGKQGEGCGDHALKQRNAAAL